MKKLLLIIVVIAVAGGLWFKYDDKADEPYTVKIGHFNTVTNDLPMFIADELGWLKKDGISYELIPIITSNQALEAVVSGRIDLYSLASIIPILSAEAVSPGKVKLFNTAMVKRENPFDVLLSLKDADISLWKGLEGKKIGVYPGSTATKMLHKVLGDRNVDMSKVQIITLPPQNHAQALLNSSVDLLHSFEPVTSALHETGKVKEVYGSLYAEILGGSSTPLGGGAVSANFIKNHPEKVDIIIKNLKRGYEFMRNNEVEARNILQKRLNLTPAVAQRINLFVGSLGNIDIENTQKFADFLYKIDELPAPVNIKYMLYKAN